MLRKRLLGAVIVRQGWAVQSFGYRRWLPLGRPECLVENLDRWGADGIVVLAIDRGDQGPDLKLIECLSGLGLSTPLTYGGGLATEEQARAAVRAGAERLVLDTVLSEQPTAVSAIANAVGVQALVAALPMLHGVSGEVLHLSHRTGAQGPMPAHIRKLIHSQQVSQVFVIDAAGEGGGQGFNSILVDTVQAQTDLPLLAFGGLARHDQIRPLLERPQVAGVVVGNALNYCEHSIRHLKDGLTDLPVRLHNHC